MDGLSTTHLALVAFWLGVVSVESVVEALGERGKIDIAVVARIHQATDRFIEIPVLLGIVLTGLLLWERVGWSAEYFPKVALGLGAVVANLITAVYVERRARGIGDVRRATILIFVFGAAVFAFAAGAIYVGGRFAGWW